MEIFTIVLCVFAGITINFAMYKSMEELYDGLPKWVHIILLIPPFSFLAVVLISIASIMYAIYDTIRSL